MVDVALCLSLSTCRLGLLVLVLCVNVVDAALHFSLAAVYRSDLPSQECYVVEVALHLPLSTDLTSRHKSVTWWIQLYTYLLSTDLTSRHKSVTWWR